MVNDQMLRYHWLRVHDSVFFSDTLGYDRTQKRDINQDLGLLLEEMGYPPAQARTIMADNKGLLDKVRSATLYTEAAVGYIIVITPRYMSIQVDGIGTDKEHLLCPIMVRSDRFRRVNGGLHERLLYLRKPDMN